MVKAEACMYQLENAFARNKRYYRLAYIMSKHVLMNNLEKASQLQEKTGLFKNANGLDIGLKQEVAELKSNINVNKSKHQLVNYR